MGDEFYNVHCPAIAYYELDKRNSTMNSGGVIPGEAASLRPLPSLWEYRRFKLLATQSSGYPSYSEGRASVDRPGARIAN
jgi:hypothetical protein